MRRVKKETEVLETKEGGGEGVGLKLAEGILKSTLLPGNGEL